MTPRATAAARTAPPRVAQRDSRSTPRRAPTLEPRPSVVAPSASRLRRRPTPVAVAIGVVIASLLAVVGGNMQLASGQLRLEQVDSQLTQLQSAYAAALASVAVETSPQALARVEGLRAGPREILTIDYVPLGARLPAPTLSSARCCSSTQDR